MRIFKGFFMTVLVCLVAANTNEESDEGYKPRAKRDAGLTAAIIGASISAGASLVGTTVSGLKSSQYTVAVSGGVANYAKWHLALKKCTIEGGYMNVPMRSVASGQREGFAGHKTGDTAKGNWVICSFKIHNSFIHFMYSAPYSFDLHLNTLAVAICSQSSDECKYLDAKKMYYNAYPFLAREQYYYTVKPLKICSSGLCIVGIMGTSHLPEIALDVYPEDYENLSTAVKDDAASKQWDKTDYTKFVNSNLN